MKRLYAVAFACLLLQACADKTVRPVGLAHYDPLPPETEVRVFKSEGAIKGQYSVIGVLRSTSTDKYRNTGFADVLPDLQQKARSIGANALIIDSTDYATAGVSTVGVTVAARAVRIVEPLPAP